jgi:hypothetical protein
MTDFRIWGRIEHIGPQQFFVIVSAVPDPPHAALAGVNVDSQTVASRAEATDARAELMRAMGLEPRIIAAEFVQPFRKSRAG